jgi:hypothetical protein
MIPYSIFSPVSNNYIFVPKDDIFYLYPPKIDSVIVTTFYDIFDGYYNISYKFNVTIPRPPPINPKYLKYLKTENNNTAPVFFDRKHEFPILFLPT